jgi:MFS family permease
VSTHSAELADSTDDGSASHARYVAVFSNIGHVFTHMFTVLYATAVLYLPSVFNVPYGELLGLSSLGLVLYGVGALPAGWLGDRWSQTGMMVVLFIGLGTSAALTGLAYDTWTLFMGLSAMGLFASIYHPVGIAWLVAHARKQGMTLGINGVFGSVGSALAPVFVGLMIDWVSWRAAFIIPGLIAVASGLALLYMTATKRIYDVSADRSPAARPVGGAIRRVFIILTLTMTCTGFVYTGLTNTMPKVFEIGLGPDMVSSYTEIGSYVGAVIAVASFSSLLGGWLADRYSARSIYLVFWLLNIPPLVFMTKVLGPSLLAVALAAMWFNTSFAAAENMLVARYTPFEWRSLAYGAKFVLALGVGGLTVQLAGTLFDSSGSFDTLYYLFTAAAAVAALGAALLPRARSRASAPA